MLQLQKRQITIVLAAAMIGKLLPLQLVYQGKTKACLPTVNFPRDVTFSPNHWCNEITIHHYVFRMCKTQGKFMP